MIEQKSDRRFPGIAAATALAVIVGATVIPMRSPKAEPFFGVDLGGVAIGVGVPGPYYDPPPYYRYAYPAPRYYGYYAYYGPGPYYYPW